MVHHEIMDPTMLQFQFSLMGLQYAYIRTWVCAHSPAPCKQHLRCFEHQEPVSKHHCAIRRLLDKMDFSEVAPTGPLDHWTSRFPPMPDRPDH